MFAYGSSDVRERLKSVNVTMLKSFSKGLRIRLHKNRYTHT